MNERSQQTLLDQGTASMEQAVSVLELLHEQGGRLSSEVIGRLHDLQGRLDKLVKDQAQATGTTLPPQK